MREFDGPDFPSFVPASPGPDTVVAYGYLRSNVDSTGVGDAVVYLPDESLGQLTTEDGRYELRIPRGASDTIVYHAIGFAQERFAIDSLRTSVRMDVELWQQVLCLD